MMIGLTSELMDFMFSLSCRILRLMFVLCGRSDLASCISLSVGMGGDVCYALTWSNAGMSIARCLSIVVGVDLLVAIIGAWLSFRWFFSFQIWMWKRAKFNLCVFGLSFFG